MAKLTLFLLLTILVGISFAQTSEDSPTATTLSNEFNGDVEVTDSELNFDDITTGSGNGEYLIAVVVTEQATASGNENVPSEEEQTTDPNEAAGGEQATDPNENVIDEQTSNPNEAADAEQATESNKPDGEQATEHNMTENDKEATEPNEAAGEEQATESSAPADAEEATELNNAGDEQQADESNNAADEQQGGESNNAADEQQGGESNNAGGEQQANEPNESADAQATEPNNADNGEQAAEPTEAAGEEQANEANEEVETTTKVESPTTTTASPPPTCTAAGVQVNQNDCHQYFECTTVGSADGSLQAVAKPCPAKMAFSAELKRCSRDIAACPLDIQCTVTGAIADPAGNSSYYYCQEYYEGNGFYIFHIHCESYQYFEPLAGRCFIDFNNTPPGFPLILGNKVNDYAIVKNELKSIKKDYKLKLKAQKELEKEKAKEAKKQAKQEEKLKKLKIKIEAASFVCAEEGNFPSQVADNVYIQCITKKTKLKAISMQCMPGTSFNAESGVCAGSGADDSNSLSSDDED